MHYDRDQWVHVMEYSTKIPYLLENSEPSIFPMIEDPKTVRKEVGEPTSLKAAWELMETKYIQKLTSGIESCLKCQSQLKTLYAEGITGCHMKFVAYNLLCVIMHTNNNMDLVSAMSRLHANAKKDKAVKHALSVRIAVTSGNYVMFFRLYKKAPNLNSILIDLYVEKMQYTAVKCITRSYRPTVPVSYLSQILGFANALPTCEEGDEKELDGVQECMEWLKAQGACIISDSCGETLLDTKASLSTLFMPEPEDAVSHRYFLSNEALRTESQSSF